MILEKRKITQQAILDICTWHYDGAYAIYDEDSYENKQRRQADILNPDKQKDFDCYYYEGKLIGYTHLVKKESGLMIGIAIKPAYCNQGYGSIVLQMIIDEQSQNHLTDPLCLIVRSWNQRAVHCYKIVAKTQRLAYGMKATLL